MDQRLSSGNCFHGNRGKTESGLPGQAGGSDPSGNGKPRPTKTNFLFMKAPSSPWTIHKPMVELYGLLAVVEVIWRLHFRRRAESCPPFRKRPGKRWRCASLRKVLASVNSRTKPRLPIPAICFRNGQRGSVGVRPPRPTNSAHPRPA